MILNNLNHILSELMIECESAIFCLSSGSHKSGFYDVLLEHKHKLKNLVIGTGNFSTTPDFLDKMIDIKHTTLILSNPNYIKKDITFNVNLYMFFMDNNNSWILINSSTGLVSTHKTSEFLHMNSIFDSEDLTEEDNNQIMNMFLESLKKYISIGQDLNESSLKIYGKLFSNHHTYVNNYRLEDLTSKMLHTTKKLATTTLDKTEKHTQCKN